MTADSCYRLIKNGAEADSLRGFCRCAKIFLGIVSIWVLFFGAVEDVETYIENRFKKEREAY